MKKLPVIVSVLLLATACSTRTQDSIVGSWTTTDSSGFCMVFSKDGRWANYNSDNSVLKMEKQMGNYVFSADKAMKLLYDKDYLGVGIKELDTIVDLKDNELTLYNALNSKQDLMRLKRSQCQIKN